MAHVTLIIGPMFSGKSTYLLSFETRYLLAKKRILMVKHAFDASRYSATNIATHEGALSKKKCLNLTKCSDISLDDVDVVLIDEGQFFDDLGDWLKTVTNRKGLYVVIAGLSGDYKQQIFQPIAEALSQADKIIHLQSICSLCGNDAPFTIRLSDETSQTLVGSSDVYQPRCRQCK